MPLYTYECEPCKKQRTDMSTIAERHIGPPCDRCRKEMVLVISPVAGIVKNPAAGPKKRGF